MNSTNIDVMISSAIKAKPRTFITPAILHSVVIQESDEISTFELYDRQYRLNMNTAMKITGWSESEILKLVTLSNNKIAKFRLEASVFNRVEFKKLPLETRFYLALSTGLVQKMGWLLVSKPYNNIKSTILGFASNEPLQLLYGAGDMEAGMKRAYLATSIKKKDLKSLTFYGYCAYNSGALLPKDAAVIKRAQEVISRI